MRSTNTRGDLTPAQDRAMDTLDRKGHVGTEARLATLQFLQKRGLVRLRVERSTWTTSVGGRTRSGLDYVAYPRYTDGDVVVGLIDCTRGQCRGCERAIAWAEEFPEDSPMTRAWLAGEMTDAEVFALLGDA